LATAPTVPRLTPVSLAIFRWLSLPSDKRRWISSIRSVLSGYKSNSDNWLQQGLSELGVENVESA
jgi:hypothetical protein